jgi:hypothetical protein
MFLHPLAGGDDGDRMEFGGLVGGDTIGGNCLGIHLPTVSQ